MGTSFVRELTPQELARLPAARQAMETAGTQGCATRFTFFAAFDGTHNDEANLKLSGDPYPTNISQLGMQAREAAESNAGIRARYYPGVGTGGDQGGPLQAAFFPTDAIQAAAEKAYRDFSDVAIDYLKTTPGAQVSDLGVAVAGFSRGAASAIRFAQLLHERGLVAPDGQVLAPPGSIPVTAMALIDPVARFVTAPMHIPPNVQGQLLSVIAEHEHRSDFRPLYPVNDPRVTHVRHPGNHVGVGGGYDAHGTAAHVLEGLTGYFQHRGVGLADVPPERRHDPQAPQRLYTEVWQTARNGDVLQDEQGRNKPQWRHDDPARGRIGVAPQVPPAHKAWLERFQREVGPRLQGLGHDRQACERIAAGCVCRSAGYSPANAPPQFLLSADQTRIGVLHRSGLLQEMPLQRLLTEPAPVPAQPVTPAADLARTPLPVPEHEPMVRGR